jgi:hypothetical protein
MSHRLRTDQQSRQQLAKCSTPTSHWQPTKYDTNVLLFVRANTIRLQGVLSLQATT